MTWNKAIWFKACPKCGTGDLYLAWDASGPSRNCVQCGYVQYLRDVAAYVFGPDPAPPIRLARRLTHNGDHTHELTVRLVTGTVR